MKKLLALVLALVMSMSLVTISNAAFKDADKIDYKEAVDVMNAVGVFVGDEKGNFNAKENLTREQAAKIIAYLELGSKAADALVGGATFTDVASSRWSAGFVGYCAQAGVVAGVGDSKFDPAGQLTALQFGKMLLVEIGYDAKAAGMTGTDWAINTSKLIATTGLMNGIDGSVNQVITREKAAQMALNALKTPTVEYDTKGSSISVNGAEINFGASTPKYVTSELASARNISSDQLSNQNGYTVELGEKLYKDLKKTATTDAFGRDASKWSIKSEVIGTYVDKSDLVETYTAKASKGALYTLVGSDVVSSLKSTKEDSGVLTVYENGKEVKNPAVASYFDKNNSGKAGISGNGVVTEVYMNKDYDVKIIQINTYLVQATDDYSAKKESVSIATVDIGSNLPALPSTISIDDFDVADVKEDDYLLVTYADDAIQSVKAAKMLEGVVSEYTENDYVVIDGTKYSYNNIATTTAETDFSVTYNAKVVLDEYGYILHVDTAVSNSNYLFIRRAVDISGLSKTVKADAYFTDGTSKEIELKKVGEETDADKMKDAKGWYTYAVNDKGQYILTRADYNNDTATTTTDSGEDNAQIITNDVVKFLGQSTAFADNFNTDRKDLKANADTLFLIRESDGTVSVYTGIANVPTIKTKDVAAGNVTVTLITNKAGTYATKVFVDIAKDKVVDILGANAGDWMFLLKSTTNTTYVDGSSYKQYKVLFEGEETTKYIESTIDIKVGELGYNIKENSKGYVTNVTKFENSDTYEVEDFTTNKTITKSGKTLSVGGVDYILTDDTVINLIVGEGCSLLKDKSASYETYLKITGSTLASILYKYEITKGQAFAVIDKKDSDTLKTLYVYVAAGNDIVEQVASVTNVKINGTAVTAYNTVADAVKNANIVADGTNMDKFTYVATGTGAVTAYWGLTADSTEVDENKSGVPQSGWTFNAASGIYVMKVTSTVDGKTVTKYVAVKPVTYYTLKVENLDEDTAIMVNGTVVSKAATSGTPTTITLKEKLVKGDEVSVTYVVEDGGTIGAVTVEGASATIFNKTITFTVGTENVVIKVANA